MQNKSVDDIWKELNAKTAPRSRTSGIAGFGIPGVASSTRVLPRQPAKPSSQHVCGADGGDTTLDTPRVTSSCQSYDPEQAGVSQQDLQAYVHGIQRLINCLTDQDRSARRSAIKSLHAKLLQGDTATPKASPSMLQAVLSGPLLQPLSVMLADPVEFCRQTTLNLLLEAAPQLSDVAPLLPAMVPRAVARVGALPVQEPAEEMRLSMLQLVAQLIQQAQPKQLLPYVADLSQLLGRCLDDSYAEVKKAAAGGTQALAGKLPRGSLEGQCEKLLQVLLAQLSHPHRQVRQAVVAATEALVLAGTPPGLMERLVAPGVRPLLSDRSPAVREAGLRMVALWLGAGAAATTPTPAVPAAGALEQPAVSGGKATSDSTPAAVTAQQGGGVCMSAADRCRVHALHLLPLLLLGVTDPEPQLAALSLQLVEAVGRVWQQAGEQAVLGTALAASGAAAVAGMEVDGEGGSTEAAAGVTEGPTAMDASTTTSTPQPPQAASTEQQQQEEEGAPLSQQAVAAALLPPPFQGLPGEGCRLLAAALLPGLLPGVVRELGEWTSRLRAGAARCLHVLLVLAGQSASPQLPVLLPALAGAVGDEDLEVVGHLKAAAGVLGAFTPPSAWLPITMDGLGEGAKVTPSRRANTLVVAACLLQAAAAAGHTPEAPLLQSLVRVLSGEEVRGSDHIGVQMQLLVVTQRLIAWGGAAVAPVGQQLYHVLLQLWGSPLQAGNKDWSKFVDDTLDQLAVACGYSCRGELARQYALKLLPDLTEGADSWTGSSPQLAAFQALLRTAGPEGWAALAPAAAPVLAACCGSDERDGPLRLSLLQLMDDLLEDEAKGAAVAGATAALLLQQVLLPPLVWRAGKTAAAVRFAAITAVATLLRRRLVTPGDLLTLVNAGQLIPLLVQCCEEDWYSDVRHTAVYVVAQLLEACADQLSDEQRRAIYPELLKRLDDSSDQVRVAACGALVAFVRSAGAGYCHTNSGYLAAGVVVHMDDTNPAVQEAAAGVLLAQAALQPRVVEREVRQVADKFRAQHYVQRVLEAAAAAQGSS